MSEFFFKSANIWQSYQQERGCLVHFLRLSAVCWPGAPPGHSYRGGGRLAAGKDRNACRKGTAAAKTGIWPSPGPPLLENDAKTYSYEDNTVATERWQ